MTNAYNDTPEPRTHVVPFATPMLLPEGKFALVEGELELTAEGDTCGECGQHSGARVRSVVLGEPTYQAAAINQWRAAGEKILKWLIRERA